MGMKATNEQILAAYRETGSVWAAGKRLNMCGQSVWERLRALRHPMPNQAWTEAELIELRTLATTCTIAEAARRLGRTYAAVAGRISALGIGVRFGNRVGQKGSRLAAFDRADADRHLSALEASTTPVRAYARANSLAIELLVTAIQREFPERWDAYTRARSKLPPLVCPQCEREFVPMTKKQRACSRKCQGHHRADHSYFGGKRKLAEGLASGVCQLCRKPSGSLSAHHILGKENDPENEALIALCSGCHQVVGQVAARNFTDSAPGWEDLINLVMLRRHGGRRAEIGYVQTHVEIEFVSPEEAAQEEELSA